MFAGIGTDTIRHNRRATRYQHHRMPQGRWPTGAPGPRGRPRSVPISRAGASWPHPRPSYTGGSGTIRLPSGSSPAATEPELGEPEAATGYGPRRLTEQGALTLISATKHPEISDATVQADLARR